MQRKWKYFAIGVGLMASVAGAHAATMTYEGPVIRGVTANVTGPNNSVTQITDEGRFLFGGQALNAFCIELEQASSFPSEYTAGAYGATGAQLQRMNTLYENFLATSRTTGAGTTAFQLALWEIVYETGSSPLSLDAGSFRANAGTDTGALSLASQWLTAVGSSTSTQQAWTFTRLSSAASQDLLTATRSNTGSVGGEVPVPGTVAMLGIGAAALSVVSRRTRRKRG